eukprot:scaffold18672_cov66-Phaeocystis_antarctica.AAC.1
MQARARSFCGHESSALPSSLGVAAQIDGAVTEGSCRGALRRAGRHVWGQHSGRGELPRNGGRLVRASESRRIKALRRAGRRARGQHDGRGELPRDGRRLAVGRLCLHLNVGHRGRRGDGGTGRREGATAGSGRGGGGRRVFGIAKTAQH